MKQNILEEIKKIQEMMGVSRQLLAEASTQPSWLFSMVDDIIETLFKKERYEDAWTLLKEYKEKQLTWSRLTPEKQASNRNPDLNPEQWKKNLSDEDKKLLRSAQIMDEMGRGKTEVDTLKGIIKKGQSGTLSQSEEDFLKSFVEQFFKNKDIVDSAVSSFYKKNPKAVSWGDIWKKRRLRDFNSEEDIEAWKVDLMNKIDNEITIPDYVKTPLKDEIEKSARELRKI